MLTEKTEQTNNLNELKINSIKTLVDQVFESTNYLLNDIDSLKTSIDDVEEQNKLFNKNLKNIKLDDSDVVNTKQSIIKLVKNIDKKIIDEDNLFEDFEDTFKTLYDSLLSLRELNYSTCFNSQDQDCDTCDFVDDYFDTEVKNKLVSDFNRLKKLFSC